MARTFLMKELGLEHLSQKEKIAVSSAKYRVYSLFLTKETKDIDDKERAKVVVFFVACDTCSANKSNWSDSFLNAKDTVKELSRQWINKKFQSIAKDIRKKIKSKNNGIAKHRKVFKIN